MRLALLGFGLVRGPSLLSFQFLPFGMGMPILRLSRDYIGKLSGNTGSQLERGLTAVWVMP